MTAFKADFRQNACYGHAHNSCPGRCAVNQITIGNGPDFVMRMGATTYSHHVSINFTPVGGNMMQESVSHPSLRATLKEMKQKLAPKGWRQSLQIAWAQSADFRGTCKTPLGTFKIRYHLINGLSQPQKDILIDYITRTFE